MEKILRMITGKIYVGNKTFTDVIDYVPDGERIRGVRCYMLKYDNKGKPLYAEPEDGDEWRSSLYDDGDDGVFYTYKISVVLTIVRYVYEFPTLQESEDALRRIIKVLGYSINTSSRSATK